MAPDDQSGLELTIVMPCLNEAETIETCIRKAQGFLERSGVVGEVVVGDNGSTDASPDIARRCGARVVEVPLRGIDAEKRPLGEPSAAFPWLSQGRPRTTITNGPACRPGSEHTDLLQYADASTCSGIGDN
jgi:copper chaperone CopZ